MAALKSPKIPKSNTFGTPFFTNLVKCDQYKNVSINVAVSNREKHPDGRFLNLYYKIFNNILRVSSV